ncbi:MAG: LacI family DNA-binding transcriptional regulator [Planctomycetia bacterium]|nr:LacI family DNA-binding transcriptional regulator [Planctomycetia bacterium]
MRATLKDVANRAGVNFTLVSKYINKNPQARMSEKTRKRVDDAIRELNYSPSITARSLKKGRSKTIGLLIGNLTNAYYSYFADLALREIHELGYQLLIALVQEGKEDEALQSLISRDVDGIICYSDLAADNRLLKNPPCPIIAADRHYPMFSEVNVDLDQVLETALSSLSGTIAGLFFPHSLWTGAFELSAFHNHLDAATHILPYREEERLSEIRKICSSRPDTIFTNGWQTTTMLQDLLDSEYNDYAPNIMLHANCTGPFLNDSRIIGVLYSSSRMLIQDIVRTVVRQIEDRSITPVRHKIPVEFLPADSPEYKKLITKHFQLT